MKRHTPAPTSTPMTPAQRRALIEKPFFIRTFPLSYPWAGCHIADTVPTEGRRVWKLTPEDEEAYANHCGDARDLCGH